MTNPRLRHRISTTTIHFNLHLHLNVYNDVLLQLWLLKCHSYSLLRCFVKCKSSSHPLLRLCEFCLFALSVKFLKRVLFAGCLQLRFDLCELSAELSVQNLKKLIRRVRDCQIARECYLTWLCRISSKCCRIGVPSIANAPFNWPY